MKSEVLRKEVDMAKDNKDFFKAKNSWSEIKDRLLGSYLRPYFQKLLTSRKPICYVDCFAGQGMFEDGKPGSPVIALQVRDACMSNMKSRSARGKIDVCFIELNHTQKLRENIAAFNNGYGHPAIIPGKYEEHIESLLSGRSDNNIFLYVDPYGIRALDYGLFGKFDSYGFNSLEMLINFNSFGFFRDACRAMGVGYLNDEALRDLGDLVEYDPTEFNHSPQSAELLNKIAGGDYWKDIVSKYNNGKIDGYQAERIFSTEYKLRLKQKFSYVLDIPIRLRPGHRPKYRMIHVCNHEDGCLLMAEDMLKRKDELFTNIQQNYQQSLFDFDDTMTSTVENDLMPIGEVKKLLAAYLTKTKEEIRIKKLLAGFYCEYGLLCNFKMLYSIIGEMEQHGAIDVIRTPATSPTGKPTTFLTEKGSQRVLIRRKQV